MLQKPIYFLAFFLLTSTLFGQNYGYSLFKNGWTFSGIGFFDNEASFIGGKATYTWDSKLTSGLRLGFYSSESDYEVLSLTPLLSYQFFNVKINNDFLSLSLNTQYEALFVSSNYDFDIPNLYVSSVGPQATYYINPMRNQHLAMGVVWYQSFSSFGSNDYEDVLNDYELNTYGIFIRFRFYDVILSPSIQITTSDSIETQTGFGLSLSYAQ
jgi:hypothetical protein